MTAVITYTRYLYPGSFMPEDMVRATHERNPEQEARTADDTCFAFSFYDIASTTVTIDGQDVELRSKALRKSGLYYIDAEELTVDDIAALDGVEGDYRILLANMRSNGWQTVARCRTGNFRPMEPGDVVISRTGAGV